MPKTQCKVAFTLAEVLITLGIIGIVAAITLPALISNYQKIVYVNQLKKSVSVIEKGFKLILADDGVDRLTDTGLWSTFSSDWGRGEQNDEFTSYLGRYFKIIESNLIDLEDYKQFNGNSNGYNPRTNFVLEDGIYFMFDDIYKNPSSLSDENCKKAKELGGNVCEVAISSLYIDVNGSKRPDQFGRDTFQFMLSNDGRLIPAGSKDAALFEEQVDISSNSKYWRNNTVRGCGDANSWGYVCAARIIENGWKMDY